MPRTEEPPPCEGAAAVRRASHAVDKQRERRQRQRPQTQRCKCQGGESSRQKQSDVGHPVTDALTVARHDGVADVKYKVAVSSHWIQQQIAFGDTDFSYT